MKAKTRRKIIPKSNGEKLVEFLLKKSLSLDELLVEIESLDNKFFENPDLELELFLSNGLPLEIIEDKVVLKTQITPLCEQVFCVVDIETNASNVHQGQIIELGAVKYQNGEIIDKFDSLVYAKNIPSSIQEVTQITPKMLENAPTIQKVLEEFKLFLQDDIFVAHDIKFDYKFISESLEKYDLGKLENRKICTIDLSKRTIPSLKYGLRHLKELLEIDVEVHHRAYSDALSTAFVLDKNLKALPFDIRTSEELITFSKSDNLINYSSKE